jgi:hypothetical protein
MLADKIHSKNEKLSPYKYMSNMIDETSDDEKLENTEIICIELLTVDDEYKLHKDDLEIVLRCLTFCKEKLIEITNIKNTFKLSTVGGPFSRIGHSLDMLTCQDELDSFSDISIYTELSFNIDDLSSKLNMYIIILSKYII